MALTLLRLLCLCVLPSLVFPVSLSVFVSVRLSLSRYTFVGQTRSNSMFFLHILDMAWAGWSDEHRHIHLASCHLYICLKNPTVFQTRPSFMLVLQPLLQGGLLDLLRTFIPRLL